MEKKQNKKKFIKVNKDYFKGLKYKVEVNLPMKKRMRRPDCDFICDNERHLKATDRCPECDSNYCLSCAKRYNATCINCEPPSLIKI